MPALLLNTRPDGRFECQLENGERRTTRRGEKVFPLVAHSPSLRSLAFLRSLAQQCILVAPSHAHRRHPSLSSLLGHRFGFRTSRRFLEPRRIWCCSTPSTRVSSCTTYACALRKNGRSIPISGLFWSLSTRTRPYSISHVPFRQIRSFLKPLASLIPSLNSLSLRANSLFKIDTKLTLFTVRNIIFFWNTSATVTAAEGISPHDPSLPSDPSRHRADFQVPPTWQPHPRAPCLHGCR